MPKVRKNQITLRQIQIACGHVEELMEAGVTKNLAIRTLELFADVYAKIETGGSATPHHINQVEYWSEAARKAQQENPNLKPGSYLRVEHGTPRRAFADKVMKLHESRKLTETAMKTLVRKYWKLAVITLDEDRRLNQIARSIPSATPDERWALAGIKFQP